MNTKAESIGSMQDTLKLGFALLVLLSGVVGFYYFDDQITLYRVLGLLVACGIAVFVGMQTIKGQEIYGYFRDSQIEVRKVVWPTKQETMQTTFIIMIVVVLASVFLWLLDMFLSWGIGSLMGHGG